MKSLYKIASVRHGLNGLKIVWREEWHFSRQVGLVILMLGVAAYLRPSATEFLLLLFACCTALASELINTAIEDTCNRIEPNHDERIGAIKDIAQSVVLVASFPAIAIFAWILYSSLL